MNRHGWSPYSYYCWSWLVGSDIRNTESNPETVSVSSTTQISETTNEPGRVALLITQAGRLLSNACSCADREGINGPISIGGMKWL